ncbi:MAG: TonB-dependent receptor [Proteobacteria bacterium]|nr:TonB-dependent receptor [Pseudomonadota bacterium]
MNRNSPNSARRLWWGASTSALVMGLATAAAAQQPSPPAPAQTPPASSEAEVLSPGVPTEAELPDGAQQTNVPVTDGPQPAGADDEANEVEAVVVTGFRESLRSALNIKRNESGVVDVIKAEDIADFPDNNLAESIQRIPGVSITRSGGEGRNITVRGLGPGSTRVRVNGMETLTTTGGSDAEGGANRNRQFDFNVFASELFNSIAVRKTAQASVEEGSLGATVDLQTSRPFDFRDPQSLVLSTQLGYNDLSETSDPRFAVLASKKFLDGRLGALVSVAYSQRNVREEGFNTVRWAPGDSNGGFCSPAGFDTNPNTAGVQTNPGTNATVGTNAANCFAGDPRVPNTPAFAAAFRTASDPANWHPRLPRFARLDYDQERLGLTSSLQYRPSRRTLVNFDVLYSEYKSNRQENYLEGISFSRGGGAPEFGKPFVIPRVFEVDENGSLVYGEFDNVDIRIESRFDEITTTFTQYTLSGSHEFSDNFKISGLIGTSKSDFSNPVQTTITFDRANQDGWIYDARENRNVPNITWGFDINDPNAYTFGMANANGTLRPSEIRLRPQFVENTFDVALVDAEYQFNDALKLRAGVSLKAFTNDGKEFRRRSEFGVPPGLSAGNFATTLQGFGKGLEGSNLPSSWVVPDFGAIVSALNIYCNCNGPLAPVRGVDPDDFTLLGIESSNARGSFRTIEEDSKATYAQLDFDTNILPWRIRGDVGVRYVETTTTSTGFQFVGGAPQAITVENTYENVLPAANVVAEVTPDILVRAAAASVIVRPGLGSLNPGGTLNTTGNLTISAGNPFLSPQEANIYDLAFEWYPMEGALYGLGFFYRDIKTGFQTVRLTGPFSSFGLPASLLAGTGRTPDEEAFFSTTINTEGGEALKGFEINIQQAFSFLPERFGLPQWTGNFGGLFNYTYVTGSSQFCTQRVGGNCVSFVENRPTGVSENAYNATLYYEDARLNARISVAHRSEYLFNVPSANAGDLTSGIRQRFQDADFVPAVTTVDTSVSYSLTEDLKVSFEGLNLTDEESIQYNDTIAQRVWTHHHFGRQYYLGLRYSF